MLILSLIYFLAIVSIALLFGGKRNVKVYAIKLTGILLLVFSLMEYVVKLSNYHSFMQIDYSIYLKMLNMKIMIYSISTISNFSIVLLIFSGIVFAGKIRKITVSQYILLGMLTAIFMLLNSNALSKELRRVFLYSWNSYEWIVSLFIRTISCAIIIGELLFPYIMTLTEYKKSVLISRKKELRREIFVWSLIDISLVLLVSGSNLSNYLFYNIDMEKFPYHASYISNNFMTILCAAVILVMITTLIILYAPFGIVGSEKRKKKILQEVNENVIMLLHTYKNAFCSIEMYANSNNKFLGCLDGRVDIIKEIADEQIDSLGQTIDMFRLKENGENRDKIINIDECIRECIRKSAIDADISLKLNLNLSESMIIFNEQKLIEVLRCVIDNSIEALSDAKNPEIGIETGKEGAYQYINVYDNGCGISKKQSRRIFDPLFSTKKGVKNFGFGLTYVKRKIEEGGGTVEIKSVENEYTIVQISLPVGKEKRV